MNDSKVRRFQLVDATLYLIGKRWGVFNGKEVSAFRVYGGTKCGTLGSVAEGGRTDLDWANVGQALFVYF
jgi:hypothetical protein